MEKNKKRILIVLTRCPYPITDGTRKKIMEDLIHGLDREFSLDLLLIGNDRLTLDQENYLKKYFVDIKVFYINKFLSYARSFLSFVKGMPLQVGYYFSPEAMAYINENSKSYDSLYIHTIRLGQYLSNLDTSVREKTFFDFNDAISLNYHDAKNIARFPWNLIYGLEEKRVKSYESNLMGKIRWAGIISLFDQKYLEANYNKENSPHFFRILPGVNINNANRALSINKKVVFLGNMKYPPNLDAAKYAVNYIFPKLKKRIGSIEFFIIGKGYKGVKNADESIKNLGFVQNLDKVLNSADFMVAPIRFGAGVPTKILEVMSYGVPVVTTDLAIRGLRDLDGIDSIICVDNFDADKWCLAIEDLLDRDKNIIASEKSVKFVRDNCNREIIQSRYVDAFNNIIASVGD